MLKWYSTSDCQGMMENREVTWRHFFLDLMAMPCQAQQGRTHKVRWESFMAAQGVTVTVNQIPSLSPPCTEANWHSMLVLLSYAFVVLCLLGSLVLYLWNSHIQGGILIALSENKLKSFGHKCDLATIQLCSVSNPRAHAVRTKTEGESEKGCSEIVEWSFTMLRFPSGFPAVGQPPSPSQPQGSLFALNLRLSIHFNPLSNFYGEIKKYKIDKLTAHLRWWWWMPAEGESWWRPSAS